ncbi:MAG: glycosyltransferase family 39 protein [candidate division WOR-3 bacterium]
MAALILRLFHFYQLKKNNPIFDLPIVDSAEYVKVAEHIVNKNFLGLPNSYYHPPFYYYFVALSYKIFRHPVDAVRIIQILMDLLNLLMLYYIGQKLLNASIALMGAIFYASYLPIIQSASEILPPVLIIFFMLMHIVFWIKFSQGSETNNINLIPLLVSASAFGLLTITLTNFLILLPIVIIFIYLVLRDLPLLAKIKYILMFLIIAILPATLSTLRNILHSKELVVISYNGGINFYIGNNPEINKTVALQPGYQWDSLLTTAYISTKITNFAQMQNYWYKKALEFIIKNPLNWISITAKKALLFFNAHEFPRNTDEQFFNNFSILSHLPLPRAGLLFPLALTGLIYYTVFEKNKRSKILFFFVLFFNAIYSLTIILMFIASRYRLPVIPFFCLYAGYILITIIKDFKQKNYPSLSIIFGIFLFSMIGTRNKFFKNEYPYEKPPSLVYIQISRALLENNRLNDVEKYLTTGFHMPDDELKYELYYVAGLYYDKIGDFGKSVESFKKACTLNPYFHYAYNQLGYLFKKSGAIDSAVYYLNIALNLPHADAMLYYNLADCYLMKGEINKALNILDYYRTKIPSPNPIIYEGLGRLYLKFKDYGNAAQCFVQAIKYPQGYEIPPEIFNLAGICYFQLHDLKNAQKYWRMGLQKNKHYQPILQNLQLLTK